MVKLKKLSVKRNSSVSELWCRSQDIVSLALSTVQKYTNKNSKIKLMFYLVDFNMHINKNVKITMCYVLELAAQHLGAAFSASLTATMWVCSRLLKSK